MPDWSITFGMDPLLVTASLMYRKTDRELPRQGRSDTSNNGRGGIGNEGVPLVGSRPASRSLAIAQYRALCSMPM